MENLSPLIRGLFLAGFCFVLIPPIIQIYRKLIAPLFPRRRWRALPDLPVLNLKGRDFATAKKEWFANLDYYLEYGRQHYRNTGYQLWGPEGYMVILPEELTNEVKLAKDSVIDASALLRSINGDVNWLDFQNPHFIGALRSNLISKLAPLAPQITTKVADAVRQHLPGTEVWTPTNGWDLLSKTVAYISSRTFVGDELGADPEWQRMARDVTMAVQNVSRDLRQRSYLYRFWGVYIRPSPQYRQWLEFKNTVVRKLRPTIEKREALLNDPDSKRPNDAIQWVLEESRNSHDPMSVEKQAEMQMSFIFVSQATTTGASMSALYDLLSQPQYIQPLVDEIDEVLDRSNDYLDTPILSQMTKLDSFIKESQRLNGALTLVGQREVKAAEGLTFSNGLHLPRGTVFAAAGVLVSRDENNWAHAEEFQGFRFSDLRAADENNARRYFLTSTGPTQLGFGHGRHSCPGRFFAALKAKAILATMLRNYEFQPLQERPRGVMFQGNTLAKRDVDIFYRSRVRK